MPSVSNHFCIKIQTATLPPPQYPYNPQHPISRGATPSAPFPGPPPRAGWRRWLQQGGRGRGTRSTMTCRCCCPSHSMRTGATDRSRKRNQPSLMASGFEASPKGHPSAFIGSLSLRPEDKRTDHKVEWSKHSNFILGGYNKKV